MDKPTVVHPRMTWEALCANPALRDLPYKIETNGYGQIVMSPTSQKRSTYQTQIIRLLGRLLPGGRGAAGKCRANLGWDQGGRRDLGAPRVPAALSRRL